MSDLRHSADQQDTPNAPVQEVPSTCRYLVFCKYLVAMQPQPLLLNIARNMHPVFSC